MLKAVLSAARPKQWVKNLFVAAPLIFAKRLSDGPILRRGFAAVAIFCAISSAVYLWNDIVDVEKDRAHPRKRHRAIASGKLSIRVASVWAGILGIGGLGLGLMWLGPGFAWSALGYLILNVAYSLWLKRVVYLDVLSISSGFLLRVLAGALAVDVHASPYLLVCTALLSCYLGFGKRAHELASGGERAVSQRAVLQYYTSSALKLALALTGISTILAYALYTEAEHTRTFFHTDKMIFTAPFAIVGLWRFYRLVNQPDSDSPTEAMLTDSIFVLNLIAWAIAVTLIIYLSGVTVPPHPV